MSTSSRCIQIAGSPVVYAGACALAIGLLSVQSAGGYDLSELFYWHPLLLTIALLLLMPIGMLVYKDGALGSRCLPDRAKRRFAHIVLQAAAVLFALAGYAAAYVSHERSEKPHLAVPVRYWSRSIHVWSGLLVIAAVVAQALGGAVRTVWRKRLPHRDVGVWIWMASLIPLLLAAYFRFSMKGYELSGWLFAACICAVATAFFAARVPKDDGPANTREAGSGAAASPASPTASEDTASIADVAHGDAVAPVLTPAEDPSVAVPQQIAEGDEAEGSRLLDRPSRPSGVRGRSPHGAIV